MTTDARPALAGQLPIQALNESELQALSSDELHARLKGAIGMTAAAIHTMALLWRELVRRGEDMSGYRNALAPFLMAVAEGRLVPQMVVQLSGQTRALERVAELPVQQQELLLDGEPVTVYRGQDRSECLPLRDMLWSDVALAIRDGRIWSLQEQKLAHERSESRKVKRPKRGRAPRISVTPDNRLLIGKTSVDAERVIAALRQHGLLE